MFSENAASGRDMGEQVLFPGNGGATLARFDSPRGSGTTIAALSDPHLTPTARGTMKLYHRTKQRFQMAVADIHRLDVDGVVVAGDLTKDGTSYEYRLGDTLVGTLPESRLVVPGNHDVGTGRAVDTGAAFARRYDQDRYPTTAQMGSVTLTGFDSTCPDADHHGGAVEVAPSTASVEDSGPRIAVMHHPLAPIPAPFDDVLPETDYRVENPERTADALVEAGIDVVLTGHLHWPFATTYRGLNVVGVPGCSTFPPSYLLCHFDSRGTTISLVSLAGQRGLAEAYGFALENDSRGSLIESAVQDGYFRRFPQVDEQPSSGRKETHNEQTPAPGEETPGSRSQTATERPD